MQAAIKRPKVDLKDVVADLDFQSDRLSSNTRTLALSLLAVSWGLLIGTDKVSFPITSGLRLGLIRVGVLVSAALVLDSLQYVSGYLNSFITLKLAEARKQTEVTFDTQAPFYRLRMVCFWVKIFAVPSIAIYFITLVVPLMLRK